MKKAILIFGTCLITIGSFSQTQNLNSAVSYYDDYNKYGELKSLPLAKEKIDLASKDESTAAKYKTWFYRGQIYLSTFDLNLKNAMAKVQETDINKKIVAAYQVVSMTEVDEALKAFQKELELDDKKIYTDDVNARIRLVASDYSDKGYSVLMNKNYSEALVYYEKSTDLKQKAFNIVDTAAINNMAICASKIKDYKKAEQLYDRLIAVKYKPEKCYMAMIQMYNDAGDTASARNMIMKSVAAMPDSYALLIEKINLFLKAGKSDAAIQSINLALAKNDNNHELHLVLGQTYNKMAFPKDAAGKDMPRPTGYNDLMKKAEDEFNKAITIKPDYFVGLYSLGVFYNNLGADVLKQSESMKDPKKVKVEEDKADKMFAKAIPVLEKAHQLDPTDKDTMRTLRQLYARTGQGDTDKYKKLNEELKNAK